jgi:hypothetical protein
MGRSGPIPPHPRSRDSTPLEYFLLQYVKDTVCDMRFNGLPDLHRKITDGVPSVTPKMLRKSPETDNIRRMSPASNGSTYRNLLVSKKTWWVYTRFMIKFHYPLLWFRTLYILDYQPVLISHNKLYLKTEEHFWLTPRHWTTSVSWQSAVSLLWLHFSNRLQMTKYTLQLRNFYNKKYTIFSINNKLVIWSQEWHSFFFVYVWELYLWKVLAFMMRSN